MRRSIAPQGHLLDVTDMVNKMNTQAGGLFPVSLASAHKGRAYSIPQSVSPWPLVTRLDVLEPAKVDPPKTWDELIEVCKKLQKPPRLTGFGPCLGLYSDTDNNVMNMIWSGGKLVEADNKTVALHSKGTVQAVQLIADICSKTQIIPKGAVSWGQHREQQSLSVASGDFRAQSHQYLCPSGGLGQGSVQHHRLVPRARRSCRCR